MNKNAGVVIGVVVLVLIAGGVYVSMNSADEAMMDKGVEDASMLNEDSMMKKDAMKDDAVAGDEMMKKDETSMMDKDDMMHGSYEAYTPEKLARAETGDVVLFFHASWCPSCRGLSADIDANLSSIPDGVSILKVDYDTETELKKKYGVTYQHTLVQVDADGTLIKKWSGGSKLSNLVGEIQ
jgi:thiol-disulfide isomerase/thioredoxin